MEKRLRLSPLLLAAVLLISLLLIPPMEVRAEEDPAQLPTVFVHGYTGWGGYDGLNDIAPYWGLFTGDILKELNNSGYHCYAASVGPLSSAWDRACELYAQLTGTRTDYGIYHSKKYGHDRYGEDFTGKALIPGFTWDANHKINLVGHSFGGTACRMFIDLLYDGAPEEVEASRTAGEQVSPLFAGGHKGMIHSFTALSTPLNGASFHYANPMETVLGPEMFKAIGITADLTVPGVYDPMLQQFGIGTDAGANITQLFQQLLTTHFYDHNDSCITDMTVEKGTDLNKSWEIRDDIYYFSRYGNKTNKNGTTGKVTLEPDVFPMFLTMGINIANYTGQSNSSYPDGYGEYYRDVPVPSIPLGEDWQPNDGMNNVISGRCPFYLKADGTKVYDPHVEYQAGMTYPKGKWIIFPEYNIDHLAIIGWSPAVSGTEVHGIFKDIMESIHQTSAGAAPAASNASIKFVEPGCPTADYTDVDHSGWYHTFVDYVVKNGLMSGTSATTFSPEASVTRAMVAQTLYAMEGKPEGSPSAGFKDVSGSAWYAPAVNWCAANGIAAGYEDKTFHPNTNITRQQLAIMFYAYAKYKGTDVSKEADLSGYADADEVASYARTPMAWAVDAGLISGRQTEQGIKLSPNKTAMRSELAVMLKNLNEKIL